MQLRDYCVCFAMKPLQWLSGNFVANSTIDRAKESMKTS